jgi:mono/diheme cytochrome c family protein
VRLAATVVALALLAGCRGQTSEKPPIRPIPDMRNQPKYRPEAASAFFPDGRAMRPPVAGTVAQGQLFEDAAFYRGREGANYLARAPIAVDEATLRRGEERYGIYCATCHDRAGGGRGISVQRGFPPPVDLASERVRGLPDGQIFEVIGQGVRNMPGYAAQIPEHDRWAIVTWVRVLQRSQHATIEDVPADRRNLIEPEAK